MTDQKSSATESAAYKLVGDLSPKLAELTDEVLFGDVWERDGLAKRDRSLATISTLVATGAFEQLRSHIAIGLGDGLTKDEIAETITHLAFYAGWPKAMSAIQVARDVFHEQQDGRTR